MPRPSSDQLFRLIKSLSKAEKRYFKIFSGRHSSNGKSDYITLFDAIDKQQVYDETKLATKFTGNTFGHSPAIAKNRLYESLLKSLHAFHAEGSIGVELQRLLHFVEILFNKSLYDESKKFLNKAKRIARKYERHTFLIEIHKWEKRLIEKDSYAGWSLDEIMNMRDDDCKLIQKMDNYTEFWNIKSRLMLLLNQKGKVRDNTELDNFKTIIDNTLLKNEENALSYETRYLYYQIYSAFYFGTGNYGKSYDFIRKHLELIEEHSELFREEPNKYFSALSNIIYLCTQLRKYNEIPLYLEKLKSIPEGNVKMNEDLAIKLFSSTYSAELSLYMQTGEFEKAIELVDVINEGFEKYKGKISKIRESYFRFTISQVYFATGNYSSAIKWINQLMNDQDIDDSQDIHCMARIFNLIIHLEAGNDELVSYTIRSTQRYLNKRNRIYKFETIFLSFINKFLKATDFKNKKESYQALRKELMKISKDPFEKSVFEYFDFISWVEGKYLDVPFRKMVKNKMNQNNLKSIEE
jgi:hypothetical protein